MMSDPADTILSFECPECESDLTTDIPRLVRCPVCQTLLEVMEDEVEELWEEEEYPPDVLNAFETVGLVPTQNAQAIKRAYLKAIREVHPDHHGGSDEEMGTAARELNSARELLRRFFVSGM